MCFALYGFTNLFTLTQKHSSTMKTLNMVDLKYESRWRMSKVQAFFLTTFMVVGCSDPLPVRWVLKPKSLSFFPRALEFFSKKLEFWSFLSFFEFWGGKFVQNVPNIAFFRRTSRKYWEFWNSWYQFQYQFVDFFWVKMEKATGPLNFGPEKALSF